MTSFTRVVTLGLIATLGGSGIAHAQAWVPAAGSGVVSLDYQRTDVGYHLFGQDMTAYGGDARGRADLGKIRGQAILLTGDYGVAGNLALSASVAYVGATYRGPFPEDMVDDNTFNGTLQDASVGLRYMVPWRGFALTPTVGVTFPTHGYAHHGHTAVGRGNTYLSTGIAIGRTLAPWTNNVWVQGAYQHEFVKDVEEWGLDADEISASAGWYPMPRVSLGGYFVHHDTQDGVDWFYDDFAVPGVEEHHDQAARSRFNRVGGNVSYQLDASTGFFVDVGGIVSGRNTHDGVSYTVGTNWSFLGPSLH